MPTKYIRWDGEWVEVATAESDADGLPEEDLFAHYDLSDESDDDGDSISSLEDHSGNGRVAEAVGSPVFEQDALNNNEPGAVLDGDGDGFHVESDDWGTLEQPYTVYAVVDLYEATDSHRVFDSEENGRIIMDYSDTDGWRIFADDDHIEGTDDESINVVTGVYDGEDSLLKEGGFQTASGDPGSGTLGDLPIGFYEGAEDNWWDGAISEIVVYDARHDSETRDQVNDYLSDKWGL